MNQFVSKFLLAGDKFMPKLHLRQLGFTHSTCGPFAKQCERIQKSKETGDLNYNQLDKACFAHDTACADSKDLGKITVSDKILKDKTYEVVPNPQKNEMKEDL